MSLAKMSLFFFGCPLDKSQQKSKWGRRPLSPRQINYAALDAFILIDIVDQLGKKLGIDFDQIRSRHARSLPVEE
jgi:ribonuclease D